MQSSSVLILVQSSSPTFSSPSTVTVSIFSCKGIKKRQFKHMYSTACHRQKHRTKHSPQQAGKNTPKEAQKHQLLNYQNWKLKV
jgi:hypothetical protein